MRVASRPAHGVRWVSGAILAGLMLTGCGGEPPVVRAAVEGEVTLDGRPLDGVLVRFVPQQHGRGAAAAVDQGRFQLPVESGPSVGEHDVVFTTAEPELAEAVAAMKQGSRDPLGVRAVPLAYQKPGRVHATVTEQGDNRFEFRLRSR